HRPRPTGSTLLLRIWVRQLLVIFLDKPLITLRNLVFLSRADIFLRQEKLQVTAQFQLYAAQWIQNLLSHFLDGLWTGSSWITNRILNSALNLVQLSSDRIVPSQGALNLAKFIEPLLIFPLPLARIVGTG